MLNKFFRGLAGRIILPLARGLVAAGVSPNALTLAGFLVIAWSCWLIAQGRLFAGGVVLVLGGVFDMIDGAVAKVGGKSTRAGAFLDSTTDRVSDALLFLAIFWQYLSRGGVWSVTEGTGRAQDVELPPGLYGAEAQTGAVLVLTALILGFVVSYIKARAEGLGLECNVGVAERPERIVLPALGLLFDQLIPALGLLVLLSGITAVQRFTHVWRQARQSSPDPA